MGSSQSKSPSTSKSTSKSYPYTVRMLSVKNQAFLESKTAAIIVTICEGSSYDPIFNKEQQISEKGTKTITFTCNGPCVGEILKGFQNKSEDATVVEMIKQIKSIDSDCTVFNWECCSGYGQKKFPEGDDLVMEFLEIIIKKGHMAMFSDFSLKALINRWDEGRLGPNPFVLENYESDGEITLKFISANLKECASSQLQLVGELSEKGECHMHTLSGTIVYSVNSSINPKDKYKLQILTVVANLKPNDQKNICKIKDFTGTAGHVLLTYPSGGKILTSMGHWIELMKVDTSERKILEMAEKRFGAQQVQKIKMEYDQLQTKELKQQYYQQKAMKYVQSSAPSNNYAMKSKQMNKFA